MQMQVLLHGHLATAQKLPTRKPILRMTKFFFQDIDSEAHPHIPVKIIKVLTTVIM